MTHRPGYTPKPPPDIWAELEAAGAVDDQTRIDLAYAAYGRWLADQGFRTRHQGTTRPDQEDR